MKFKFGEFEADLRVTDVSFVEKYEDGVSYYNANITKVRKDGKASEIFSEICDVFFRTFDIIFGEDTHKKMFGGKKDVELCADAFRELVDGMKRYDGVISKLSGTGTMNRAQRRAKK